MAMINMVLVHMNHKMKVNFHQNIQNYRTYYDNIYDNFRWFTYIWLYCFISDEVVITL